MKANEKQSRGFIATIYIYIQVLKSSDVYIYII